MRTTAVLLILTMMAANARAEGLLYQLPPDGIWVRFEAEEVSRGANAPERRLTGFLFLRSVGRVSAAGEPCRWIEIEHERVDGLNKYVNVFKVLVPEKRLQKGQSPLDHVVRGWFWQQHNNREHVFEIAGPDSPHLRFLQLARPYLQGPLKDVKILEKQIVDSKLGQLECDHVQGRVEREHDIHQTEAVYDLRLQEAAPFGVVSMEVEFSVKRNRKPHGQTKLSLKLADWGENAASALPDKQ